MSNFVSQLSGLAQSSHSQAQIDCYGFRKFALIFFFKFSAVFLPAKVACFGLEDVTDIKH